jgi:hypothetical protein
VHPLQRAGLLLSNLKPYVPVEVPAKVRVLAFVEGNLRRLGAWASADMSARRQSADVLKVQLVEVCLRHQGIELRFKPLAGEKGYLAPDWRDKVIRAVGAGTAEPLSVAEIEGLKVVKEIVQIPAGLECTICLGRKRAFILNCPNAQAARKVHAFVCRACKDEFEAQSGPGQIGAVCPTCRNAHQGFIECDI